MSLTKTLILAAALLGSASAHMKMVQPPPFGPDSLTNAPLNADGSNFPCKNDRPDAFGPPKSTATMPIGAKQTLQLQGGATHGGGSCQISLTKDQKPTKDSQWMVIHSIEGGCPNAAPGNLGDDASALDPTTFEYSIPDGIAAGQYSLAWTWFNKIGNREMYMNCAPIVVSGGSKKRSETPEPESISLNDLAANHLNETMGVEYNLESRAASNFPAMFVANVPTTDCVTVEGGDLQFPDPGTSLDKTSTNLKPPTGPKCAAAGSAGSSGSSSSSGSSAPAAAGSASPAASPAASPSAASPASPGTATILASPSAAAPAAQAPAAVGSSASSAPAPASAAPATGSSAPAVGGSSTSSGGSCTPGQSVCSADGTQIGECDGTGHVTMGPVAAGTKCVNGQMAFARRDRVLRRGISAAEQENQQQFAEEAELEIPSEQAYASEHSKKHGR